MRPKLGFRPNRLRRKDYYAGVSLTLGHVEGIGLRLALNTALIGLYGAVAWFYLRRRPVEQQVTEY